MCENESKEISNLEMILKKLSLEGNWVYLRRKYFVYSWPLAGGKRLVKRSKRNSSVNSWTFTSLLRAYFKNFQRAHHREL